MRFRIGPILLFIAILLVGFMIADIVRNNIQFELWKYQSK